jgi:hypothetical protein
MAETTEFSNISIWERWVEIGLGAYSWKLLWDEILLPRRHGIMSLATLTPPLLLTGQ